MKRIDRFRSLADVRVERDRLKGIRDHHQTALKEYWDLVHEPEFRRGLAGDAFGDMLKAWKPMRTLGAVLQMDNGSIGNVLGMAVGARARTFKGRILGWVVGAIAPILIQKFATPDRLEHLMSEIRRSWDRIRSRATHEED